MDRATTLERLIRELGLQTTLETLIYSLEDDKEYYVVEVRHGLEEVLNKYKGRYEQDKKA